MKKLLQVYMALLCLQLTEQLWAQTGVLYLEENEFNSYENLGINLSEDLLSPGQQGQATLEFWIRSGQPDNAWALTDLGEDEAHFMLRMQNDHELLLQKGTAAHLIPLAGVVEHDLWHHVAITFLQQASEAEVYVNGIKKGHFSGDFSTVKDLFFYKYAGAPLSVTEVRGWRLRRAAYQVAGDLWTTYAVRSSGELEDLKAGGLVTFYGHAATSSEPLEGIPGLDRSIWKNLLNDTQQLRVTSYEGRSVNGVRTDVGHPILSLDQILLTATRGDHEEKVVLTWPHIAGVTSYQVYRDGSNLNLTIDAAGRKVSEKIIWEDESILPLEVHAYRVRGLKSDGGEVEGSADGFIFPNGTISGEIKTEGEVYVKSVEVTADAAAGALPGSALGFRPGDGPVKVTGVEAFRNLPAFTIEFWLQAASGSSGTVFKLGDASIGFDGSILTVLSGDASPYLGAEAIIDADWHHYAITFAPAGGKLYRDGEQLAAASGAFSLDLSVADHFLFNAEAPSGTYYLDEFRMWADTLAHPTINARKHHLISGTEAGLKLYYRFDLENEAFVYNQAPGSLGQYVGESGTVLHWQGAAAQPPSLVYGGFTTASGQYVISHIHSGPGADGMPFAVSPRKPNHEFLPQAKEVTLKRSLDKDEYQKMADFTDISALPIAGKVLYIEEGNKKYPVPAGQQLLLDGQVVTGASDDLVTDANGVYSISAPLGLHTFAVNNAPRTRYFGNQSLYLENTWVQSANPLDDRDSVTLSGWVKRGTFTDTPPAIQTVLQLGDMKLVLKDNERLALRSGGSDLLVSQVILDDAFTFFAFSLSRGNGKLALSVKENFQIETNAGLSGLNLGGNLALGANGTVNAPEEGFTGYIDQLEYRSAYYTETNLSKIREGKLIAGDEAVLLLSYSFEQIKGRRAISVTPGGYDNYLYWETGASWSRDFSANYTREYVYDYLASNLKYNPAGSQYTLNVIDPVTDLDFENRTRFGFIGNLVIPCENNLGAWTGEIKRTDLQGFSMPVDETNFNADSSIFKVEGLVPGHYQLTLTNAADPLKTIESGIMDITEGWVSADFEVRNPLELSVALYAWDSEKDTVGTPLDPLCDGKYELQAATEYVVMAGVFERYSSGDCPVENATVSLDGDMGVLSNGFSGMTGPEGRLGLVFAANRPNFIGDYTRTMNITATHEGRVTEDEARSYNTGSVQENNNFTIEQPVVSMVLHDPPGDGSSLTVNESFTFSHKFSFSEGFDFESDFSVGLGTSAETFVFTGGIGVGLMNKTVEIQTSNRLGVASTATYRTTGGNGYEWSLENSFSTPSDDTFTGLDADVYIGMGLVVRFGTGKTLTVDSNCNASVSTDREVNRIEESTPFIYTHQDIKDVLLEQLDQLLQDADANGYQDSVEYYQTQMNAWNSILTNNENLRNEFSSLPDFEGEETDGIPSSASFSGLTSQTYSFTRNDYEIADGIEYGGSSGLYTDNSFDISPFGFRTQFDMRVSMVGVRKNEEDDTETDSKGFTFTLFDDDAGDHFNVDIRRDTTTGFPIFKTQAGQSMCPFESGTQPREGVELISDAYDVHALSGEPAVYHLTLRNTQLAVDNTPKRYYIAHSRGDNPDGAIVRYNGDALGDGLAIDFGLDGNSPVGVKQELYGQLTLTPPDHAIGDVSYEDIPVVLYSGCEADGFVYLYHLDEYAEVGVVPVDTVYLSAYFHAPCVEEIDVSAPADNWVVNGTSGDQLELVFKVPGLTDSATPSSLTAVKIQYAVQGNNTPNLLTELPTDTLQAHYHPADQSIHYTLNVSGLSDGDYQLRLAPQCGSGNESWRSNNPTAWIPGSIYRIAPLITEVYPPENSVMTTGTISASYDRTLDPAGASSLNVSLRGILGGLEYLPKAADFNALTDEIIIPHQEAIDLDGAYTIEFWVNPSAYANNGDQVPILEKGSNFGIYLTASGHLSNGRGTSGEQLIPFKWTHVAVVYDGDRNVKTYFDGKEVADIGNIIHYQPDTVDLSIGAVYLNDAFRGQLDEIRIWNKARSAAEISTDRTRRLLGNEEALMAYYVLDDIALEGEGVRDYTGKTNGTSVTGISWVEKEEAAPINVEKVIQDVPIDVIVSGGRQLLISPKPNFPEYYLEGAELTAFIADNAISDLYGNPASGKSWSFVIDKNAVNWERNNLVLSQIQGSPSLFDMALSNGGGTNVTYEFTDLPVWLSIIHDEGNGTLPYGFTYSIGFKVAEWVNPGQHEAYVKVVVYNQDGSRAGVESFLLEVNVDCVSPDYAFESTQYPDQIAMAGTLTIAGELSEDESDRVAVYLNGELRGVGHVIPVNGMYLIDASIYGYTGESGPLEFRVWDASGCKEYQGILESYSYQSGVNLGSLSTPVSLTTGAVLVKSLTLPKGFHWVSFNLKDPGHTVLSVGAVDGLTAGDQISSQSQESATYLGNGQWSGSLTELSPKAHYLMSLTSATTIQFIGEGVSVNTDISVAEGTTWVGYLSEQMVSTTRSLISLGNTTAANGDQIAGREGFAEFLDGEWIGSLTHLTPNRGYRITSSQPGVLNYYGIAGHTGARFAGKVDQPRFDIRSRAAGRGWQVEDSRFPEVMYVSGVITGEGLDLESAHMLGAFSGEECRGVAVPQLVSGQQHYFMALYGHRADEELVFRLVDGETGEQYSLVNVMDFNPDASRGTYHDPYVWEVGGKVADDSGFQLSYSYPNPFSAFTTIRYELPEAAKIQVNVTNLTGRLVKELVNGYREAGIHEVQWHRDNERWMNVPSGTYFIRLMAGKKTFSQAVIVQ